MSTASTMLDSYPKDLGGIDIGKLAACIEACIDCADACLSEDSVADLVTCIRTDLDCADICETTGRVLSRHTGYDANLTRAVLEACAMACKSCGDECAGMPRTMRTAAPAPTRAAGASRPAGS